MKKRVLSLAAMIALSSVFFTGCKEDETPVNQNEIQNGFVKISLSVHVVPSSISTASTKKVQGLAKAKVTVSQANNKKMIEVDESGIAVFPGLLEGPVSIYVESEGYASVNQVGFLNYQGTLDIEGNGIDSEVPGFSQTTIVMPRLSAKIKGTILGDFNFSGGTPTPLSAPEAKVIARVDSKYQPSIYTSTVQNGVFSFDGLPEGVRVTFDLDYNSVNTTVTPNRNVDWEIGMGPFILGADATKAVGNIYAGYSGI